MLFVNTMVVIHRLVAVCLQCYTGTVGRMLHARVCRDLCKLGGHPGSKGHFSD